MTENETLQIIFVHCWVKLHQEKSEIIAVAFRVIHGYLGRNRLNSQGMWEGLIYSLLSWLSAPLQLCKWQYINWIIIVIIIICPRSLGVKAKQMLERLHFILGVVWAKILKPEIALYVERRCKWKSLTRWSSVCDAPLQFSFTKCLVNHCCE